MFAQYVNGDKMSDWTGERKKKLEKEEEEDEDDWKVK